MIYLACDDSYFTLGVITLFAAISKNVTIIDIAMDQVTVVIPHFNREDTLILAIERTDLLTKLLTSARKQGTRTLLIMDNASERTMENIKQWSQGVLSKKMQLDTLPLFLDTNFAYLKDLSFLTRREIDIMGWLATGKTPYGISRELNLSVKTIFSHKLSALKKLGLSHLNARSLLIFSKIFQGLAPL